MDWSSRIEQALDCSGFLEPASQRIVPTCRAKRTFCSGPHVLEDSAHVSRSRNRMRSPVAGHVGLVSYLSRSVSIAMPESSSGSHRDHRDRDDPRAGISASTPSSRLESHCTRSSEGYESRATRHYLDELTSGKRHADLRRLLGSESPISLPDERFGELTLRFVGLSDLAVLQDP